MRLSEIKLGQFTDDLNSLYKITNLINGRVYIGLATLGMDTRLFNPKFGYITSINSRNKIPREILNETEDILLCIKDAFLKYGLENFDLEIVGKLSESLNEEVLISKYDSVLNGYNKTLDGLDYYSTKYGTKSFNNGKVESRLPAILADKILEMNPTIKLGSLRKSGFTRKDRFVWMNNGVDNIRLPIHLYDQFLEMGYSKTKRSEVHSFNRGHIRAHNEDGDVILVTSRDNIPEGYSFGSTVRKTVSGMIRINNGVESIYINPDQFEQYSDLGYVKGSLQETNEGRIMVNKDGRSKMIRREDLESYLSEGWVTGMSESGKKSRSGRTLVNKDGRSISVKNEDLDKYLNDGYSIGLGRHKESPITGKVAINKDGVTKYIKEEELDYWIKEGWSKGGSKRESDPDRVGTTLNKVAVTDGLKTLFMYKEEAEKLVESGAYRYGMAPRKNKKLITSETN